MKKSTYDVMFGDGGVVTVKAFCLAEAIELAQAVRIEWKQEFTKIRSCEKRAD